MREVLALIEKRKQELTKLAFFDFLQDTNIDPKQRLAWAPCFAFFAMDFRDFNKDILRKEPATDKIQEMINLHTYEDARHWVWFLQDIKLLQLDHSINFTDTLRFLWGEETQKIRQFSRNLFALCTFEEDVLMKLAIIESIEAMGFVFSFATAQVTNELRQITKQHYPYFGESHHAVEQGHLQADMENVENFIENIQLTQEQQEKAFTLVNRVFADFTDVCNEMVTFAKTHSYHQPFTTKMKIKQAVISA
ncbi:hypothetical protein [Nostoc sp. TCL26-01]|uniref:hypothetical protein n=1 Tax=Nostoc sp. TCL26-01 TaxID=2576904 RepID=UPI0015C08304|nr:hypothetical protein [Nostoc sp. TCL26-01]QLE57647.1 hypothetical protein FD725_20285 [Nostoc sp. TCL26-01]